MVDAATHWRNLWSALGAAADPALLAALLARYAEPHRRYHTLQHLQECLAHFDASRGLAEHPAEVEVALWFHDAIYEPRRQDNEARSADWASEAARRAGLPAPAAERIHALVMATCHRAVPHAADAQLLVDIDLSILGAAPERFDEYERQVAAEYAWVPLPVFRGKRAEILREFLARPAIYSTARFRRQLEAQARANLERSLSGLVPGKTP